MIAAEAGRSSISELGAAGGEVLLWIDGEPRRCRTVSEVGDCVRGLLADTMARKEAAWTARARLGFVLVVLARHAHFGSRQNVGKPWGIHPRTSLNYRRLAERVCDHRGRVDPVELAEYLREREERAGKEEAKQKADSEVAQDRPSFTVGEQLGLDAIYEARDTIRELADFDIDGLGEDQQARLVAIAREAREILTNPTGA